MKGLALSRVWSGMTKDIEVFVRDCDACQTQRNQPPPVALQPWPLSQAPWERVHVDYAGPVASMSYPVVVDSYSKWIEVVPMRTTMTEKTLDVLLPDMGCPKNWCRSMGPSLCQLLLRSVCNRMEFITPRVHLTTQPLMWCCREGSPNVQTLFEDWHG